MTRTHLRTPRQLKRCWNLLEFHLPGAPHGSAARAEIREKARRCFEAYLRRFGDHPRALYGLGLLWYRSPEVVGSLDRAEHLVRASLELFPSDPWPRMVLALICFEKGKYADALAEARRTSRDVFLSDERVAWRAIVLEEVELASRVLLKHEVADAEWRDLVDRYIRHASEESGAAFYPREAVIAARAVEKQWVVDALEQAWRAPLRVADEPGSG